MTLSYFLLFEGILIYIIFANIRKSSVNALEALVVIVPMFTLVMFIFSLNFAFGITAILGNGAYVIVMTLIMARKNKNINLSLVYAIFANVIVLLSGNLAGAVLTLAYFVFPDFIVIGRDGVIDSVVMSIAYAAIAFTIAFTVSRMLGCSFHARISTFDAQMQRKLVSLILPGAFITLGVFFVVVFLRYIPGTESILILAYALSLSIIFIYLVFSIFTFTDSLYKDIELKHKDELLHNLEAYTEDVEDMATQMRQFRHDHKNLMLGFRAHADNKDWESFDEYYERYMGEFDAGSDAIEVSRDRLGNIKTPELKSILFAKFLQASTIGIDAFIEVERELTINDGYCLLDTCRITGILMDNAIEACKDVEDAIIRFMATMVEDGVHLVFQNTCLVSPPMNQITQKGFTTKEDARGLGLHNVSQMVAKNKNLTIKTSIKENFFTQELKIALLNQF